MGNNIARLFGIENEEKGLISILLIQSVFLGIFLGVLNIAAHSLFLAKFDEVMMARAYILSGVVGIVLTYIYTHLQSVMRFQRFSLINLSFVLIVTLVLWFIVTNYGNNLALFALFIMMGPLSLLSLLTFYGTTGRLFTLRQGKRLFGLVDTGIVIGSIISYFSIPALLKFGFPLGNLILFSVASMLAVLIVQGLIGRTYTQLKEKVEAVKKSKASMKIFREDSYIMAMGLFIALSVVVAFFIQYSFMAVTKARYPLEQDFASFLGLFEGSMMVFTLLIKTFIFSYLIKNHGLKITLAVGPILIGIFVVIAVIVGSTMGYLPETGGFMIFFLILAVARLFSKAMKDSLETPAFKVLYQTLAEKLRYNVQSAIDGTVNEIAALASGLMLTGLGALTFVKLIHFSWVLAAVILLWIYMAIRLYREYRDSVKKSINIDDQDSPDEGFQDISQTTTGAAIDVSNNYFKYISSDGISGIARSNRHILDSILNHASTNPNTDLLPLFKELSDVDFGTDSNEKIKTISDDLEKIYSQSQSDLRNIGIEVERVKDRKAFVNSVFASGREMVITDLLKLLRDKDYDVRREAIYLVGKHKIKELLPDVCDGLNIPQLSKDAYYTLKSFEADAFDALSTYYFRSSGKIDVRTLIIRLFSESESNQGCEFLLPRLWSVHRDLRRESLKGLLRCNFVPDEDERDKIIQEIQEVIGLLTWNIAATVSLKKMEDEVLLKSLEEETEWWSDFLFGLLSLIYDKKSFDKIRANLKSGTVESVNLALEMVDIVVEDAIKPRLTALLDVVSEEDKLKSLFQFYPGEIPDYNELVIDLINTDYNRISVWTKSCALKSLYKLKNVEDPDFVIALLFSPNKILREEALRYLKSKFDDVYGYCEYRVPEKYRGHLSELIEGKISSEGEIFNKINFLNVIFEGMPLDQLLKLAMNMKLKADSDRFIDKARKFVVWPLRPEDGYPEINWIEAGQYISDKRIEELNKKEMYYLSLGSIEDAVFERPDESASLIGYFEKNLK